LFISGTIDSKELLVILNQQGLKDGQKYEQMVKKFDANGDGKINLAEFAKCLNEGSIGYIRNEFGEKVEMYGSQ
jgi:Ca2+-binding EF-hand superfamily protein